eukprot:TRINITY_DN16251_c0_g1_i4.p1 TRINITY_DN16251_c0_g1~~TRINITY_DN16251_c0_g1_i4.p1  ORF type:complete len:183 (-),score=31.62 TRINITY_DN16251_c0_g1_i4:339-887(-)
MGIFGKITSAVSDVTDAVGKTGKGVVNGAGKVIRTGGEAVGTVGHFVGDVANGAMSAIEWAKSVPGLSTLTEQILKTPIPNTGMTVEQGVDVAYENLKNAERLSEIFEDNTTTLSKVMEGDAELTKLVDAMTHTITSVAPGLDKKIDGYYARPSDAKGKTIVKNKNVKAINKLNKMIAKKMK